MPNDPDKFNNFNGMNNSDNQDDFIDSSFAVQFKPGDKTESIADNLKVMDQTAFTLCKENGMPIIVFNMNDEGTLEKVVEGTGRCTVLSNE